MLRLRPYKTCDTQAVTSWIKSERALRMWSADRYDAYPISPSDMNAYYEALKDDDTIWAMTAFDDAGVVGHLTMRYPDDGKKEIRFGFVIVDDAKRGMGYGREMLTLAARYAFDFIRVDKLSLAVFKDNLPAIRCYEAVGFREPVSEAPKSYECMGERWDCIRMELNR